MGNSGNFAETRPLFWSGEQNAASPFAEFMRFSDWFFAHEGKHHGIALARLAELAIEHGLLVLSDEIYGRILYDGTSLWDAAPLDQLMGAIA